MTRPLRAISGSDPLAVMLGLRAALSGSGPAVLPLEAADTVRFERQIVSAGQAETVPQRVALLIQTSGSTGRPKRVALSTDALLASATASAAALGGPGQWLLALPTHYIAGAQVLVRSIVAETDPVILPSGTFDPRVLAEHATMLTEPLRFVSLVPVQLARVVDAAETDEFVLAVARRFDRILVGGQATPPTLIDRAETLGLRVTRTYGSSETAGGCVYDGVALNGTAVRIEGGLVELGGPMLAEGYVGDAARTAETFVEHDGRRWYRTGDLGEFVDGRLRVLGRSDNVIISGGEKVSLDAVERVLHTLPGFEGAVAVAVPDTVWGQAIAVACETPCQAAAGGSAPDAAERPAARATQTELAAVREHVASVLGTAARPRELHSLAELPRLASGKPDRAAIAALIISG